MNNPVKMEPEKARIVFMGTPGFAVGPLDRLIRSGCEVAGVVTAPDKPAGRGKKLSSSAIKQYLLDHHPDIPLLQPSNLKDPEFIGKLGSLRPDLQVVVAFRMLPEAVWRIPPLGTFNLHASLLPQYRGAAPINHVIMNGEKETGVTTFLIDHQIDTGNILLRERIPIGEEETAGKLHDRLMEVGSELVVRTVRGLATGSLRPRPQTEFMEPGEVLHPAPKLQKEDGRIDWRRDGRSVVNLIRGLSPYPGAYSFIAREGTSHLCKIFTASYERVEHGEPPGTLHSDGKKMLKAAVADGYVHITSLQLEGKRRMETPEFLAGFHLTSGPVRFS